MLLFLLFFFVCVYDWIKFRKMPMDNLKSNMPRQFNGKYLSNYMDLTNVSILRGLISRSVLFRWNKKLQFEYKQRLGLKKNSRLLKIHMELAFTKDKTIVFQSIIYSTLSMLCCAIAVLHHTVFKTE